MEQISSSSHPLLSPRSADSEVPRIIVTKPYEEQCPNRSNSLDSQQPLMVKVDQRFVQQSESLLNRADRFGQNIEHVASIYLKKAGSQFTRRRIPALFTIESIVFAINASELTIATICLVAIYFLRNFVSYYLNYLYYIPIIAAGVYFLAFLMVWRMKRTIRERTGVFLLVLIFMICEALMLCWLAPVYSEFFMLAEVSIACLSMYALTGHAMILRRAYSASTGRLIAVLFAVIGFVAHLVVFRIDQRTTVYMAMATALISIYLWAFANKVEELKEDLMIEDTLKAAIFIALEMYETKVKWIFKVLFFWVAFFKKRRADISTEPHSV